MTTESSFLFIMKNQDLFRSDFYQWLSENRHIFEEFERRALKVAQFRQHYSARTIIETMRHDTAIRELSGDWKLNNNYTPCQARLFSLMHPQFKDLFEFREQKVAA